MLVTQDVKVQVTQKIKQCIEVVNKKYGTDLKMPSITYDLTGTTAGTANYVKWHIRLNSVLLMQNVDDFMKHTVPHEFAHLACDKIYPEAHRPGYVYGHRTKREVHGPRWASIMHVLGAEASRCHSYDVTDSRKRKAGSRDYKCACGAVLTLSERKHTALVRDPYSVWHTGCRGKRLTLVTGTTQPIVTAKLPTAPASMIPPQIVRDLAPRIIQDHAGMNKFDRCQAIFLSSVGNTKSYVIARFMSEVGMTAAGASTYYYKCKGA